MIVFIALAGSLVVIYLVLFFILKQSLSISQIRFQSAEDLQNRSSDPLISDERLLRKTAFENVSMHRSQAFYTDEDMEAPFDFIVVTDRKSKTPLLSSRSYTNQSVIRKQLHAHDPEDYLTLVLDPDEDYVLLDRLSGNLAHPLFLKMRERIFMNYYIRVLKAYPKHHIILMARSSPDERLLTKYLRLGFHIVGKQKHNGVTHWIVLLPGKKSTKALSQSAKQYFLFKLFT
ncbi:hypothetical protein [uncultured Fluviicola sp.]|uniref:hypothetical protein n=1 Tax=uncultured Fluviicola sp. TaxID=463303 RepID=UPI0025DF3672|nr:hypothetical protein [uncultured Fluviicola sp.]